jgi:hypothetical protein
MQLEHLCDVELTYRREPLYEDLLKMVVPYDTLEGSLYGEGDGAFQGQRLSGTARWVNHARRRSDGVNLPDMHGVIRTDDGAFVLFTFQGRTLPTQDDKRRQLLTVCFEAEDERYRWLNTAICVLEGLISSPITGTGKMRARIYSCVHELD